MIENSRQLSVEAGDDLADGLGSTSRGGDDVSTGTTSTTPVLGARSVHGLLSGWEKWYE